MWDVIRHFKNTCFNMRLVRKVQDTICECLYLHENPTTLHKSDLFLITNLVLCTLDLQVDEIIKCKLNNSIPVMIIQSKITHTNFMYKAVNGLHDELSPWWSLRVLLSA